MSEIVDIYTDNCLFFQLREDSNSQLQELLVGVEKGQLRFSYRADAYKKQGRWGKVISSHNLCGEIETIGVSNNENLVIITQEGRKTYSLILEPEYNDYCVHLGTIATLTAVEDDSPFEIIYDGKYHPRQVKIEEALSNFVSRKLDNADDFSEICLSKLLGANRWQSPNSIRPSLSEDSRQAYNQLVALLVTKYKLQGRWKTLQMVETSKYAYSDENQIFQMLTRALEQVLEELVAKNIAEEKELLLKMRRWKVKPPPDQFGESQVHEVLLNDFVIAFSE